MSITTINRTILETQLQALRLPLTAAERLAGKANATAWPPTVAFETFEAQVKTVVGSIWRDQQLLEEGRLLRAKIAELAEAERLEVKADAKRAAADAELDRQRDAAEHEREEAQLRTEARQRRIEQTKAAEQQRATAVAGQRKTAAAKADDLRERVVTAQDKAARRRTLETESDALDERTDALAAEERAEKVDTALRVVKGRRKAI